MRTVSQVELCLTALSCDEHDNQPTNQPTNQPRYRWLTILLGLCVHRVLFDSLLRIHTPGISCVRAARSAPSIFDGAPAFYLLRCCRCCRRCSGLYCQEATCCSSPRVLRIGGAGGRELLSRADFRAAGTRPRLAEPAGAVCFSRWATEALLSLTVYRGLSALTIETTLFAAGYANRQNLGGEAGEADSGFYTCISNLKVGLPSRPRPSHHTIGMVFSRVTSPRVTAAGGAAAGAGAAARRRGRGCLALPGCRLRCRG